MITSANAHGEIFFATGGEHIISDDWFISIEHNKHNKTIKQIEEKMAKRNELYKLQQDNILHS